MENEAIEFHDSVLKQIDREGDEVRLLFRPAYVHRSSGEPGVDPGTGWSVDVDLILFDAMSLSVIPSLPGNVWEGTLRLNESVFRNIVAIPFEASGSIALRIELMSGDVVEATGTRARLGVIGGYTFVESFK